jgi:hypothetical protein
MTNPSEVTKDAKGVSREQMLEEMDYALEVWRGKGFFSPDDIPMWEAIRSLIAKDNEPGEKYIEQLKAAHQRAVDACAVPSRFLNPPGHSMTAPQGGLLKADAEALAWIDGAAKVASDYCSEGERMGTHAAIAHLRKRIADADKLIEAAKEITPGEVEQVLDFCPHVPTSIQELLARAIDRKPGIP